MKGEQTMVSRLIQAMIALVIGLALLPVIVDFVDDLTGTGGVLENTTTGALVDLLPVLYVIILVVAAVSYMAIGRRS